MEKLSDIFFSETQTRLDEVRRTNRETLDRLGPLVGRSIAEGGILHAFGSGHSAMVALEIIGRAGALVPVSGITDPLEGKMETLPGYGARLVERYHRTYGLAAGEFVVVVSNSGKNPSPIEVALECRKHGLSVIAISSLEMSGQSKPAHPGGKRLFEIADHVLDNRGVTGDAVVPVPGTDLAVGPTSTLTGALIMNLLMLEIVQFLRAAGHSLPILRSQNMEGGMEFNRQLAEKYKGRLSRPL